MELRDAELRHEVAIAKDEKSYQKLLAEFNPDVILSPYSLKGTNAIKLLGLARTAKVDAPFILLAFDLSEDIAIDLLAEGMEDYVQQSTMKRLPVAIRKALQRHKTQLELQISENRLRASEAAMRNMVRNAPIAMAMFDLDMNYLEVSETWLNHEEKSENIIGRNHYEVVPEIPDSWKKVHQEVLKGAIKESEYEKMLREDGTLEYLRWKMNPWYDSEGKIGGAVLFIEDITAKVVTRQQLLRNKQLLSLGEEVSLSGSFEFDLHLNEITWSDNLYTITGFKEGSSITNESFQAQVHPDDIGSYTSEFQKFLDTGIAIPFEYRFIRPDNGSTVHFRVDSEVIVGSDGKPRKLIGSVQDITKQVALTSALKENEHLMQEMAENIAEVFWLTDWINNKVLFVSSRYESLYGLPVQSLYDDSTSWVKKIHPEDVDRVSNDFRSKAAKGTYDVEYRIVDENGNTKWVRDRAFPIKSQKGNVVRVAGITEEITQQKADKQWIETLSLVASETINGVLIQDAEGKALWVNKGFTAITGYEGHEVLGKEPWSFLSAPETNQKLVEITYEKTSKGKAFSSENQLLQKNGKLKWVHTTFTPVLDDTGKVSKIVSIGTDIDKQKEIEELQRSMLVRMEDRVTERTTELEAKNLELREEIWENQRISDELYHHNLDLKDSIEYAKRIQESILPAEELFQQSFSHGFILFLPRDVVSGDFYWYYKRKELSYFAAIDCTGHGVPGALMSMIANELMNQAVIQKKLTDPAEILTSLNKLMIRTLHQKDESNLRDGMDLGLIVVDHNTDTLRFSGAFGSMYLAQKGDVSFYPGSRHSVGGHLEDVKKTFETTTVAINKGDTIYLNTDGFLDQFGGPDCKKYMKKRFLALLQDVQRLPLNEQKDVLESAFNEWKGSLNQVDDVLVAGLGY